MRDFSKYDRETYMLPFWEGDVIYNESVMFVGEDDRAPLLYEPTEVISVRSMGLDVEYVRGKDYEVENGEIVLLPGTSVPHFKREDYYLSEKKEGQCFGCTREGVPYIFFTEKGVFSRTQVYVTYRHVPGWNRFVPQTCEKLDRIRTKLTKGEPAKILVFGDSISTGCNSSGWMKVPPFTDPWFDMAVKTISARLGNDRITLVNTAVGGTDTNWAIGELQTRAIDVDPDLMILGFGMNDGNKPVDEFCGKLQTILDRFTVACPDADVAMIATMLPNKEVAGFFGHQIEYEPTMYDLAAKYAHVGVVPMTSFHKALLERKRYYDMTGNNVNHPNDFMTRAYAQTVVKCLIG